MAETRINLKDIKSLTPRVNRAKLDATTDADIVRQIAEDPDTAPDVSTMGAGVRVLPPVTPEHLKTIRKNRSLSQEAMARELHVPVGTLRNWEQGRTALDPVARALLRAYEIIPDQISKALKIAH
jgi:putative transcriptional regulator